MLKSQVPGGRRSRGAGQSFIWRRTRIFRDDRDRAHWLELLAAAVQIYRLIL